VDERKEVKTDFDCSYAISLIPEVFANDTCNVDISGGVCCCRVVLDQPAVQNEIGAR
jgi:hypothetical protein